MGARNPDKIMCSIPWYTIDKWFILYPFKVQDSIETN